MLCACLTLSFYGWWFMQDTKGGVGVGVRVSDYTVTVQVQVQVLTGHVFVSMLRCPTVISSPAYMQVSSNWCAMVKWRQRPSVACLPHYFVSAIPSLRSNPWGQGYHSMLLYYHYITWGEITPINDGGFSLRIWKPQTKLILSLEQNSVWMWEVPRDLYIYNCLAWMFV